MFVRSLPILLLLLNVGQLTAQDKRYSFTQSKMGSPFTIIAYSTDSAQVHRIADTAFAIVDSLTLVFSDYIDSSEVNQLSIGAGPAQQPRPLSPHMLQLLRRSRDAFLVSNGAFDITMGPLTRLWRNARKQQTFPAKSEVDKKLHLTGFQKLELDTIRRTAKLTQAGMQLDFGGIAQGYIAQQVKEYLVKAGITTALIDASGDIVTIGKPPGKEGWRVAVNLPEVEDLLLNRYILVNNEAVTTSGDLYQYMEHEGKRYSHILRPGTGYGITVQRNVTVVAADGTLADWLTKACSILPLNEGKKLATRLGAGVLLLELRHGKPVIYTNAIFEQYWETPAH